MEVLENQQGRPLIDVGGDGKVVESVGKIDCRNDYYQGQQSTNPGAPSSLSPGTRSWMSLRPHPTGWAVGLVFEVLASVVRTENNVPL